MLDEDLLLTPEEARNEGNSKKRKVEGQPKIDADSARAEAEPMHQLIKEILHNFPGATPIHLERIVGQTLPRALCQEFTSNTKRGQLPDRDTGALILNTNKSPDNEQWLWARHKTWEQPTPMVYLKSPIFHI